MSRFILCIFAFLGFTAPAYALPESFSGIVEPVMPAVVNISTTQKVTQPGIPMMGLNGMPDDPQFKELFREFNERFGSGGIQQNVTHEVTSLGSGFVIDPDGYIVTNSHVIANAEDITVIFGDDTHLKAKLIGTDPKTDLALLKVKALRKLTAVHFGDSDAMKLGDWVIAVGNPFGLGGSVSAGIVSARGRNIHAGPFDDFIQTDAAINRGNSGGPLFNMKGEVVGINAAIFSPNGGNIGIGFAVPSAMAKPVIDQLRANGKVQRAWLGVKIQDVNSEIADALGLGEPHGALVLDVSGPATDSGIKSGDVVVKFDGHEITQHDSLPRLVADAKIGKKVDVVVWRKGKESTYSVKLGELPLDKPKLTDANGNDEDQDEGAAPNAPAASEVVLGMQLESLSAQIRAQLNLPKAAHGLVVANIDLGGEAARRGIQPGDLIEEINQTPVDSVKALKSGLEDARKSRHDFALLKIQRRNAEIFVAMPAGNKN